MTTTSYRVVRKTTNDLGGETTVTTKVVWTGTDLDELSRQFPPSNIFSADDLGHHEIEDGWIRWDHTFEKRASESEEWQKIKDPRRRLDPQMSDYEAAIYEEHLRHFPGDCEDDYDEYYDYYSY